MKQYLVWVALIFLTIQAFAQPQQLIEQKLLEGLSWRNIGPFRGGRCVAVAGVPSYPLRFYMGTTGGGVWKTEDAGQSWDNCSDGFFKTGSIGAIAVAPSDHNTIYVGTGEHPVRGVMTSAGDGIYKSQDGGRTWQHLGLKYARHISAISVHPRYPNIVYAAVQGAVHGPSDTRGIYRSMDGGMSWQKTLFINETTGAASLSMDPSNPRILYAGMWDHLRTPWNIRSGGEGSGLYRSTDGGLNWEKLGEGLPAEMGKVGVCVAPSNPAKVYAVIEAENGGVYRSADRGEHWELVNNKRVTVARAWYYTKIAVDPTDEETVYVLNAPLLKSNNGGKDFTNISNPHTDQHSLWVNPRNPEIMALANDGGATVTLNGGKTWSTQSNQPTAQLYRIATDNRFPYYIYAGQQDNSTIAIPSQTADAGISARHWYPVAGGESAFIALDPDEPRRIYGGSYQGNLSVYDQETKLTNDIMAYPALRLGKAPRDMKYRFNWNAPLLVQPQNPNVLFHAANVVLRSEDSGLSWKEISPDLTRNEPEKQGLGGGPYTNEGAGGENYNTISYLACSPHQAGVIWAGSDDGLVHLTTDEGKSWKNVTPPNLGEAHINSIEVSPHNPSKAYVVAMKYKFNNFEPLVFITEDEGNSWRKITRGIDAEHFLRVVREDPIRPGLLYAGSERGLYVSFNDGLRWQSFQLNLPVCPINDLAVHGDDLIAATSGRSFWILDGLSPLRQIRDNIIQQAYLFEPVPAVRYLADVPEKPVYGLGKNPPNGLQITYYLPEALDSFHLQLEVMDVFGNTIRTFTNEPQEEDNTYEGGPKQEPRLPNCRGLNVFHWDLRRKPMPGVPNVFILGGYEGSLVPPGKYKIHLTTPYGVLKTESVLMADPRLDAPQEAYIAQQELLLSVEAAVRDIHQSVQHMRNVKRQVEQLHSNLKQTDCNQEILDAGKNIITSINSWENNLIQPRQETQQDVINYPNRLSAELMNLKTRIDHPKPVVTQGALLRLEHLLQRWADIKKEMREITQEDISAFNELFRTYQIPAIMLPLGAE
jgi:photosystem II stability/assembly factor-like uncharacterized protein